MKALAAPAALLLLAAGCAAPDAPEPASSTTAVQRAEPPSFYLGGIQVNEEDPQQWIDALQEAGMNTVHVTEYAKHGDWDSDNLWWEEENPHLLAEIRAAKKQGLHVVLILRVDLDQSFERNKFLWHGMILPGSDDLIRSFFEKYARFTGQWAEIAEREGVDALVIGSEMNALASTLPLQQVPALEEYYLNEDKQANRREQYLSHGESLEEHHLTMLDRDDFPDLETYLDQRIQNEQNWARGVAGGADTLSLEALNRRRAFLQEEWTGLIAQLRTLYSGPLGYAANFDQYHEVGFWSELDQMGINAYFKVRDHLLREGEQDQLYGLLEKGWTRALQGIADFRKSQGLDLPVLFTEMGYTWHSNSTLEPWAHTGFALIPVGSPHAEERQLVVWLDQPEDLDERALAVRALRNAHAALPEPFLKGILYWKLSTIPSHKDVEPFVMILGQELPDPMAEELRGFVSGD